MSKYIAAYKQFPKKIFRISPGGTINLRPYQAGKKSFDVVVGADNMDSPNGASTRPQGEMQTQILKAFKGSSVVVYEVPAGTPLPSDLILIHEHSDHYSLQPSVEMELSVFNAKITAFLQAHGKVYSRDAWFQKYDPSCGPSSSASASGSTVQWLKDPKSGKYYYIDPKTKKTIWRN